MKHGREITYEHRYIIKREVVDVCHWYRGVAITIDERLACITCLNDLRSAVYPCGHMSLCVACAHREQGDEHACPICREKAHSRDIFYVSIPNARTLNCMVCDKRPRCVVLSRDSICRHLTVCEECARATSRCPECETLRGHWRGVYVS